MELQGELVELDKLEDYRVSSDDPDPRGWAVVSCDAESVGVVRTLLVDTRLLKARFYIAELERERRSVALPVIYSRLDPEQKRVIFDTAGAEAFSLLPPYVGTQLDQSTEDRIHQLIAGTTPPHIEPGESADRRKDDRRI